MYTNARRVVATGMGAITPIGLDPEEYWRNLCAGVSGAGPITRFDVSNYPVKVACEVKDFDATKYMAARDVRRTSRFAHFAVAAAAQALADANFAITEANAEMVGVVFNTGGGGMVDTAEETMVMHNKGMSRVSPFFVPSIIPNMASGQVSLEFGAKGPVITSVAACASSIYAFIDAYHLIARGEADVIIAGGTEAGLTPILLSGLGNMMALSRNPTRPPHAVSRPFDAQRDGFVFGEGGGAVILESLEHAQARGARIYAEVLGGAQTGDAYHITAPAPGGAGAALAMTRAIKFAGLQPEDVDYVVAHGTSTPLNDASETAALHRTFGDHARKLAISSNKSMIGHLLGAAGAASGIAAILALRDQIVPPTINYEYEDPQCDLDYVPNVARPMPINVAIINGFGFGGQNGVAVFKRYQADA
ncbi:MAG TPA: beta-ketoacyl-ACP synthase II [Chloroflexia bacterium]|nr:beta-ketoacyl-ACP synthase II [Chloroflexia bacterium]